MKAIVWQILKLLFQNFAFRKKMDEFNYLQFLNNDNELLQAEDLTLEEFQCPV